jgi:DNA-3-methyladenine glycosylase II
VILVDLTSFYRQAALDEHLAPLVQRFFGLKPPIMPSVFETLVSAIACQQLSLVAGMHRRDRDLAVRPATSGDCAQDS